MSVLENSTKWGQPWEVKENGSGLAPGNFQGYILCFIINDKS